MTTNEVEAKLAQNRKNAFIQARLAVKCCEANTDKNKCIGCRAFRICREVLETVS